MPNLLPGSKLVIRRTRSFFIFTITIAFHIVKCYVVLQSLKSLDEVKGMTNTITSDLQTRELGRGQKTKPSLEGPSQKAAALARVSVCHVQCRNTPKGYQLCIQFLHFLGLQLPTHADSSQQQSIKETKVQRKLSTNCVSVEFQIFGIRDTCKMKMKHPVT